VEDKNPVVDAESGSRLIYSPPSKDFQGYDAIIPAQGQFEASLSGPIPGIKPLSFLISGKQTNYDSYLSHGFNLLSPENKLTTILTCPMALICEATFLAN
jgi:hypothetical protein